MSLSKNAKDLLSALKPLQQAVGYKKMRPRSSSSKPILTVLTSRHQLDPQPRDREAHEDPPPGLREKNLRSSDFANWRRPQAFLGAEAATAAQPQSQSPADPGEPGAKIAHGDPYKL